MSWRGHRMGDPRVPAASFQETAVVAHDSHFIGIRIASRGTPSCLSNLSTLE
jgi:hypothetical protein